MNAIASPVAPSLAATTKTRIASIDLLRGAVMIIMALDHVRDYFSLNNPDPTDLSTTTLPLFLTRWITHFCAPTFVLLSGTSAFLSGQRKTKKDLSSFLMKRGAWLVMVELCIVTLGWTFDPLYHVFILQVIWTIGWSMILLGLAVRVSPAFIFVVGLVMFFGHNLTDVFQPSGNAWTLLMTSRPTFLVLGPHRGAFDLYAVLPWTGVMFLGYSLGQWFATGYSADRRRKNLLILGFGMIVLFLILRFFNTYGDRNPWSPQATPTLTLISFLNVTKYPCSLMYLLMTLGPAIVILALTEKASGVVTRILSVYGRVPFFYYVCHLYLIHLGCVILFFATGHALSQAVGQRVFFLFRPLDMGFHLPGVYLVWLLIVTILYFPSRWYDQYKKTHRQWWLSYL